MVEQHSGTEIRSHTVPTVIREIYRQGATGQLVLHRDATTKNLFFEKGRVVFASSNDRDDRLDQAILNRGALSLPHLMQALDESLKTQQRLGAVLLARNWMSKADLEKVLEEQLKEIVFSVFAWTDGRLDFRESTEGIGEKVTIQDHPLDLVLEGIRRVHSWARVYALVGGMNTEYRTTLEAENVANQTHLAPTERQILNFCEQIRTLSEVCQEVPVNGFSLCKHIWALLVVGALMKA